MTLLIVLASILGYLYVAHRVAIVWATNETNKDFVRHPYFYETEQEITDNKKSNYLLGLVGPGLIWPVYLLWSKVDVAGQIVTEKEKEKKIENLEAEIARLELSSGIVKRDPRWK